MAHSLPSLDAGFRHPCRNDGPSTLVYNDEHSRAGTIQFAERVWQRLHRCPTTGMSGVRQRDAPDLHTKVISNNESTKTEINCPRKSRTIPPQITLPSWGLAFLPGAPSPSLAFGWDVLYWISPKPNYIPARSANMIAFKSATARSSPTNTARAIIAWPMFNSRTIGRRQIGPTL